MTRGIALLVSLVAMSGVARADRYEAVVGVRAVGVLARIGDDSTTGPITTTAPGGGLAVRFAWGVRNYLDLGGEVTGVALTQASYENASRPISNTANAGTLTRTTRLAHAQVGATFRFGVRWVPLVGVGVGAGVRHRSTATLRVVTPSGSSADLVPDDGESTTTVDLVASARVGLDYRANRRLTVGLALGATECLGASVPDLQLLEAGLHLSYTWYPLW